MDANQIPFSYGEFYDFPRMIHFRLQGVFYFLRSYFDEDADDYSTYYDVYILPFSSADEEALASPLYWMTLEGARHLGRIPIAECGLDTTRRKFLDGDKFVRALSALKE